MSKVKMRELKAELVEDLNLVIDRYTDSEVGLSVSALDALNAIDYVRADVCVVVNAQLQGELYDPDLS